MTMTKQDCVELLTSAGFRHVDGDRWQGPGNYEVSRHEYDRPAYFVCRRKSGYGIKRVTYYFDDSLCSSSFYDEYELSLLSNLDHSVFDRSEVL